MKPETLRGIMLSCMMLVLVVAWAVLLYVACHVASIVLDTLDMIVQLAAISP